jgi:quercetin dioxygenase-like cupin family protein
MGKVGEWEDAEPGVRRKILNAEGSLMMMEVHFAAGAEGYEHAHVHEQMGYCIKGSFDFTLDGRSFVLNAGDSVYIPSNARHGAKAREPGILLDVFTPIRADLLTR